MATYNSSSIPCYPVREAVSNGVLQGDNPIKFALPLLVIQIAVVLLVTRIMSALFKPLRQPRVLAEIIGGVLLGPSALGRNKAYLSALFPTNSLTLLETIANLGLLFFLFMVGLELDLSEIRKSGKYALLIALTGISMPFLGGVGVATILHKSLSVNAKFGPLVVFMGVPLSITAFPVLVRIMAERKLLTTSIAKLVVPAAAINDVCAWILLAIGVAISGPSSSPATPLYVLLCGLGFVLVMLLGVRRLMEWIAHRVNAQEVVGETYVCITLLGVLIAGFTTDAIGIHPLFGAFVFGLIVPKEGTFAQKLIEKVEDFVTVLMLPLFFAMSGLKTNLGSINSAMAFGFLVLLTLTAAIGKICSTTIVALALKFPVREAFTFGFLMNTKGLVELIVLNIGRDLGIFDDQTFAILVLMCLILVFFTTPAVMALYKPARTPMPYNNRKIEGSGIKKGELRILACIHGTRSIPALLNLVEACRVVPAKKPLKLYAMHLIELSDRTSSIISLSRANTTDLENEMEGSVKPHEDNAMIAFETYGQISKVPVTVLQAVSDISDMHYDVCSSAAEKRVNIIILPYNVSYGSNDQINPAFNLMNLKVMDHAPCSVGVLVDRGQHWGSNQVSETSHKVAIAFFGGPDDREAIAFGCRLAEHPNVKVHILRFKPAQSDDHLLINFDNEQQDEKSISSALESSPICYEEHMFIHPIETVVSIAKSSDFSLILAGRGSLKLSESSHGVLGHLGEALAACGGDFKSSIFVIQQHKSSSSDETELLPIKSVDE